MRTLLLSALLFLAGCATTAPAPEVAECEAPKAPCSVCVQHCSATEPGQSICFKRCQDCADAAAEAGD